MSCDLWQRFKVRKADYDADERLRDLLESNFEEIEYETDGTVTCTDPYGGLWALEDTGDYCEREGVAYDWWREADLECPARYRTFRPGEAPVDAIVDVDLDLKTYVLCEEFESILSNKSTTDKEKVTQIMAIIQKADFPCPLISDYRSSRETASGETTQRRRE